MSALTLIRTHSDDPDFRQLVALLDRDLAIRDGEDHTFYAQFNQVDSIKEVIVAYQSGIPVGCGAFKPFSTEEAEVKRMYVHPNNRKQGIAAAILSGVECWARELGFQFCVLETGKKQPEAIALYQKSGYSITANYGQYIGVDNSVCMIKSIVGKP